MHTCSSRVHVVLLARARFDVNLCAWPPCILSHAIMCTARAHGAPETSYVYVKLDHWLPRISSELTIYNIRLVILARIFASVFKTYEFAKYTIRKQIGEPNWRGPRESSYSSNMFTICVYSFARLCVDVFDILEFTGAKSHFHEGRRKHVLYRFWAKEIERLW